MTLDDLIDELDDARQTAKENNQASAMVSATMSKAKLLGLDRADSNNDDHVQPVEDYYSNSGALENLIVYDKTAM